tara:strand:+ start:733 stop:1194 length:462 start_codon:yes stop_codon:yes gene_type:complete
VVVLIESGLVVSVESDCLWVETVQRSTCGSCVAQKGCGQSLLAKWAGRPHYLRVLLQGRKASSFEVGAAIDVGIPEDIVALGAMFVYILPLFTLVLGASFGHFLFVGELPAVLGAVFGTAIGAFAVRCHAAHYQNDARFQPVVVERLRPVSGI